MSWSPSAEIDFAGFEFLEVQHDGDLLRVRLDDPARANALSPRLVEALTAVFQSDLRARGVRAVILSGAGKHFSSGADLDHLRAMKDADIETQRAESGKLRNLFESVLRQEALTIALVHGSCVAGGCGLATACDFVIAADDASFLYSEVKIGFVAALVATYLPLRLRGSDLRELLLFPQPLSAARALEVGLANRVVAREELENWGREMAAGVLANASSESIARTKRLLLEVLGRPLDEALARAAEANAQARGTDDCKLGVATFLETKRAPTWR